MMARYSFASVQAGLSRDSRPGRPHATILLWAAHDGLHMSVPDPTHERAPLPASVHADKPVRRSPRRKLAISCVTLVVASALAWIGSAIVRSLEDYGRLKSGRGWVGRIHQSDQELGHTTVAGARGGEVFPVGPEVPVWIDAQGFRIPENALDDRPRVRPVVLALGCSFTFGAACRAEDTFAWKVGERLGGSSLNAGVCSHGVAQMTILARRMIAKERPDIVLVQYSPWLIARSRYTLAPTYIGLLPTPRYVLDPEGEVQLAPPEFESLVFDLPIAEHARSESGLLDATSFVLRVGLPLHLHDDVQLRRRAVRSWLGLRRKPASEAAVVRVAYAEIAQLCARHGARAIVVALDRDDAAVDSVPPNVLVELGFEIVQATNALEARLDPRTGENFARAYHHWRGDPPEVVDDHPNAAAHALVAEEILRVIEARR